MRRGGWSILSVFLIGFLVMGATPALAKKSGSSFSSGGKSSSSSSSGKSSGWSNSSSQPAAPPVAKPAPSSSSGWSGGTAPAATPKPSSGTSSDQAAPAKPAAGGSWSNTSGARAPSGTGDASGTDTGRSKSSFAASGQTAVQKEASRKAYDEYQGKFAKPGNPAGDKASTAPPPTRTWDNYQDYRNYRDTYYAGRGWSPPGYAYQSAPSFGLWDAMFLWFMLRQAGGAGFLYNHQSDPGVQAFRQEADKLAASNADLKKQLADLDAKMAQMQKDGVAADPKRMPDGVDPAVALAAEKVVREEAPAKSSGHGTWLWIAGAGLAVAAVFLFLTRNQGKNTRV